MYTRDLESPNRDATNILFADDITQIIENYTEDRQELARQTAEEIERVNKYERCWKISTNINKFKMMSISKLKPANVTVEGNGINFANQIKTLGLTMGRTGVIRHISNRKNYAKS